MRGMHEVEGFARERMPIAHGDRAAHVEIGRERPFEFARLELGEPADGRMAADGVVMFAHDGRAAMGDIPAPGGGAPARRPGN